MSEDAFVSADIDKIVKFENDSTTAITEFNAIKTGFEDINTTLLSKWIGEGADSYKADTGHILEKIQDIQGILDEINNGVVKDIKEAYLSLDEALDEFNRNPQAEEGATE
ncbi:MAG: hypothetical protein LBG81_04600 [Coriobacteriaceae bacterium]|jgi:uncharacterized protein YukE|nr:hypothetical protein [Coriobacteriaceae bacterium]